MASNDLSKLSIAELEQNNQALMAQKQAIRQQQLAIQAEINGRMATAKLDSLTEAERKALAAALASEGQVAGA
jgi:hypothetical protein